MDPKRTADFQIAIYSTRDYLLQERDNWKVTPLYHINTYNHSYINATCVQVLGVWRSDSSNDSV